MIDTFVKDAQQMVKYYEDGNYAVMHELGETLRAASKDKWP